MKYPNANFTGMDQVTDNAIRDKIYEYSPKGAKLARLEKVASLAELIDFCIEDYRAWADAVLMGAGAYLKIGKFPAEIAAAKAYVKEAVGKYLAGTPFRSADEYNSWHKTICLNLSDRTKFFGSYADYRSTAKDKFKNTLGFTVGNAQKFLNMLMKDLYACFSQNQKLLYGYEDYFKYCHMPLDSYILRFVDDIRYRERIKKARRPYTWGGLSDYDAYMDEQNDIRNYVEKYNPEVTVLQTEFVVWQIYNNNKQ